MRRRLVGDDAHVRGDRSDEYRLLDIAQRLAPRAHLRFRLPNRIRGAKSVEQRLRDGEAHHPGVQRRRLRTAARKAVVERLRAGAQPGGDLRAVAGQGLGHVLIRRPKLRALGIELRIHLIDVNQGLRKRIGARGHDQPQRKSPGQRGG